MSRRTIFAALVIALAVFSSSRTIAAAQGPVFPGGGSIDNQYHTIGPNGQIWYVFNYAGDKTTVTITLANGVGLGLSFNLYAPDKPNDQPIGRGTSSSYKGTNLTPNCNNGDRCVSPDLTWTGGTSSPGTYHVQVINNTATVENFLLTITSGGVTLGPSSPAPIPATGYVPGYVYPYTYPNTQPYVAPYVPYVAPSYSAPTYVAPSYNAPYYAVPRYIAPPPPVVPPYVLPSYNQSYVQPYVQPYVAPSYTLPYTPPSNQSYVLPYGYQPYYPYYQYYRRAGSAPTSVPYYMQRYCSSCYPVGYYMPRGNLLYYR